MKQLSIVLLAMLMTWSCNSTSENEEVRQPNIIFIMADDLGWGDVGYNGQTRIKTPVIDALAAEGMIFNRMYAGSTVCGPSRASLITGFHPGHSSVRGNPRWTKSGKPADISNDHSTVAEVLKSSGYNTAVIGKWGLAENLSEAVPLKRGFDYFYGFNRHGPAHHYYPEQIWENDQLIELDNDTQSKSGTHVQELFTQKALSYIEKQEDKPFFLYLAYTTPHYELTIPEEFKAPYKDQGWPLRKMKPAHYLHDENGHVTYAAMVSKMDADIGRLLSLLDEKGIADNTIIMFTSDNGHHYDRVNREFFNSNGPFRGKKRDLYEGGIRVPFVVRWPSKIPKGLASDHPAAFWDVKATLNEIAGATPLDQTDGVSFLPTLLKTEQPKHDYLYWEFNEGKGPIQALMKGDWKLLFFKERQEYELYHLGKDPGETENLVDKEMEITALLKKQLSSTRTEHPEFPLEKKVRK